MSIFHMHPLFPTFLQENDDIINSDVFQQLHGFHQHLYTSRYDHSLNVAFLVFLKTRHTPEYKEAMLGALCHDLFIYNHYETSPSSWQHLFDHPVAALETTQNHFEVTTLSENMILSHMWPLSSHKPQSKHAWWLVTMDKVASLIEIYSQVKFRASQLRPIVSLCGAILLLHQL
jgi:uncharacterized protein